MSQRRKRFLFILLAVTLLGCALTAQLQDDRRAPTPTSQAITASATDTPRGPTTAPPTRPPTAESSQTPTASATPVPSDTSPPPTASPTPSPPSAGGKLQEMIEAPPRLPAGVTLLREPVALADYASAAALAGSHVPVRDLRELAIRLRGVRPDVPPVIRDVSPDYEIGALRAFSVDDLENEETFFIEAELRYKTEHVYMWVERGVNVDQSRLERAADIFESRIYPENRAFFGSEWTPGVDGDPHLSILHARRIGSGTVGYYSSADEYPTEVRSDSNQMEMFYINADNVEIGSAFYLGTLAHEFQHMIHWHNDRNEETWLNEGLSELASLINGFDPGSSDFDWSLRPDTQLNTWSNDAARSAHYGGAYLFTTYLLDRFGEALTQAVVAHPDNGIASINAALFETGTGLSFDDLFADWVAAVYLDDPGLSDGRFGYDLIDTVQPALDDQHDRYPVERLANVSQYGVDYIYLQGGSDLTLDFYGNTRSRLLNTRPHSGDHLWYANRGDDSDMRLTRAFDLSELSRATLRFWTWYDIEPDWDYGYVVASNDDGATWQILRGPATTDTNPNGNSYGWGYTGLSGRSASESQGDGPVWIEEQIDLSVYTGQRILVRFEYITDDAVNHPGWAIDDITIPELGYQDDAESDDGGWLAEGFVRTNNLVPQGYLVQLITFGPTTTVQRLPLGENQSARWRLTLADANHGVLLVSALAPVTTEPAAYFYRLEKE